MRTWIAVIIALVSIALGIYVGLWLLFIGGINQAFYGGNPGVGIFKALCASPVGGAIGGLGVIVATHIYAGGKQ